MLRWPFFLLAMLVVLALAPSSIAQEYEGPDGDTPPGNRGGGADPEPPPPEPELANPLPAVEKDPAVRWERTIYVPFRDLRAIFEKEGEGVYVPRAEFEKLWKMAMDRPDRPDAPTARYLVTRALYEGRVEGDLAVVEATIDLETFREGWTDVPLGLGNVALGEAKLDGEAATLSLVKGAYRLLVPTKGKHSLTVSFVSRIGASKDGRAVAFSCPAVPVARLDFTVPGEGVKVTVEPNLATTRTEGDGKTTRVRAYVGGAGKVSLRWKPRPVELATGPALLLAETRLVSTYGDGVLRTDAKIAYRILRAPVDSFSVRIPDGIRVLFVGGKDLREWNVEGSGDARRVTVKLHTAVRDAYELTLTLEAPADDLTKPVPVPAIVEENVLRSQGLLVVRGPQDTQIRPGDTKGIFRVNLARLPKDLASNANVLAYRFPGHPWELPLLIERILPRVTVVERTVVNFGERTRRLHSFFDVSVARAGIFQLVLEAPEDLEILEVGPANLVEDWRLDGRRLVVDLKGRREGALTLSVVGEAPFAVGDEEVESALPLLGYEGAERMSGTIGIRADESFELKTSKLEGLDPLDPATALRRLLVRQQNYRLLMALRHQTADRAGSLLVRRKKPEVSAASVTRVKVEENRALVTTDLDFTVRYAGVDTFEFDLPADLPEDDVVVTAKELKEKTTALVDDDTRRRWTITTQSKHRGNLRIRIESHRTFEALRAGGNVSVVVPDLRVGGVIRETHWYAVTKDPVLQIESDETSVEVVDPRELPAEARKAGAFLAFRTLSQPHRLTLEVRRHEYVALLDSFVGHLHIDTKVSRQGVALHTATLSLRSTGRQYLAVRMPDGAKIQEVQVGQRSPSGEIAWRPERPRTDDERTLVPLGARGGGEVVLLIRIVYRQDDLDVGGFLTKSFELDAPRFGGADGEVPVGGSSWRLWLPSDVLVTATSGNMSRRRPFRSWVAEAIERHLPSHGASRERTVRDAIEIVPEKAVTDGVRLDFTRAEGGAVVGASFGSPALFALLQILSLLLAAGAGLVLPRRKGWGKATVCLVLVVTSVVLLAFAGPGMARILNAVLLGAVFAGAVWIVAGLASVSAALYRGRPVPAPAPLGATAGAAGTDDAADTKEEKEATEPDGAGEEK